MPVSWIPLLMKNCYSKTRLSAAQQYDTGGYYDSPFLLLLHKLFCTLGQLKHFSFISDTMGRTLFKSRGWDVKKLQEKYEAAMRTPSQGV